MASHLAGRAHTRCTMLLLVLRDGSSIGITDHDKDITFDVNGDGAVTYQSGTGILASDVVLQAGLDADNYEVTGPLKDDGDFTLERVVGGRFNRARAYLFQVNWKDLSSGAIKLLAGNVSEARVEGGRFVFEVRSDCDRFNQTVGRLIVNNCDADFGDARCGITPEQITGTVSAVSSASSFTVTFAGTYADDYFNLGTCEFATGELAGTDRIEIFDWTAGGVITLFIPLVEAPAIGDTCTIKTGCSKARISDNPAVRTCKFYDNVINFRGFPEIPGTDQTIKPAIPGQGND
jgi:uncharacterized phage protein (TIGR02218 family)